MKSLVSHVLRDHVLLGAAASLSMLPYYGWSGCLLFWIATVLIDLDHYARFLWKTGFRFWSPQNMFRFFQEVHDRRFRPEFIVVEYLHTVEAFAIFAWLALTWKGFLIPIFAGFVFHELVDIVTLLRNGIPTRRCYSMIEYVWRIWQMRRRGLDPEVIYEEARVASGLTIR